MKRLDVAVVPGSAGIEVHRLALRSLPTRYRVVPPDAGADVLLAGHTDSTQITEAVVRTGAKAVFLDRPTAPLLRDVEDSGTAVFAPSPLVDDRAWSTARKWLTGLDAVAFARFTVLIGGRDGSPADLTHANEDSSGRPVRDGLVDACNVLLDAFGPLEVERAIPTDGEGVEALLWANELPISLIVTRVGGTSLRRFEALGPAEHLTVDFASPNLFGVASSAGAHGPDGSRESSPVHENGWRAAWRRLHDGLTSGAELRDPALTREALALAKRVGADTSR